MKRNLHDNAVYRFADTFANSDKQCLLVQLACQRFLRDLENPKWFFDVAAAERIFRYFRMFRHSKGMTAGSRFELRDEQKFFYGQLFGFRAEEDGLRRFGSGYRQIPRKNGKSNEAGGIAGYCLTSDDEPSPEVYSLATSKKQARESFTAFKMMARTTELYRKKLEILDSVVRHASSNGVFEPLPADADNPEGKSPSFAIYDEYHLWRSDDLKEAIRQGMGARRSPLELTITTAGVNRHGPCYQEFERGVNILNGRAEADGHLVMIYAPNDAENIDPLDEDLWHLVNPALGVSKSIHVMRKLAEEAMLSTSALNHFLCKQINIWTSTASSWLRSGVWDACKTDESPDILKGKSCYAGIDLSDTKALTSLVLIFPPQDGLDRFYLLPFFWVPGEDVREKEIMDKVSYRNWEGLGHVYLPKTKYIHWRNVFEKVIEVNDTYKLEGVAYDRWGAKELAAELEAKGIKAEPFGQGYQDMSPAIKSLEERLIGGELAHFGNQCLAWNVDNVLISTDPAGNVKMDKSKATGRIDGAVASAMAMGCYEKMKLQPSKESIYNKRGMRKL